MRDSREEPPSEPGQPTSPNGTHCPICGKELERREGASFYEEWSYTYLVCPDRCALAAEPGGPCQSCKPGSVSIEWNCPQCGGTRWDLEENARPASPNGSPLSVKS